MFKGVDFFPHGTKWKIIEKRVLFVGMSWALALLAAVLLFTRGLNYGVDFKGGSLIEVQSKSATIDVAGLRENLHKLGLGEIQVQGAGINGALVRVAQQPGADEAAEAKAQEAANTKIKEALSGGYEIRRTEVVGPAVSSELKLTGIYAVIAAICGIMLYVWFRFEWQFAVAAIVALVHDVFITVGMFSILWYEFDLSVVAALLTLAGYSINDTVVVFDRIRENVRLAPSAPLAENVNAALVQTLGRSLNTSITVLLTIVAMLLLGGASIREFLLVLLVGIISGTYSSVGVAAQLLVSWEVGDFARLWARLTGGRSSGPSEAPAP